MSADVSPTIENPEENPRSIYDVRISEATKHILSIANSTEQVESFDSKPLAYHRDELSPEVEEMLATSELPSDFTDVLPPALIRTIVTRLQNSSNEVLLTAIAVAYGAAKNSRNDQQPLIDSLEELFSR